MSYNFLQDFIDSNCCWFEMVCEFDLVFFEWLVK